MYWKCPRCGDLFVEADSTHECREEKRFTIRGEIPDGEPLPKGARQEKQRAMQQDLPLEEGLFYAFHLVLAATGRRDGYESAIDPITFWKAIRKFRPASKFPGRITEMDEKMYACRVAHRLLNQVFREVLKFGGGYGSDSATDVRARELYAWIRQRAAAEGIDPFMGQRTDY